MAWHSWISAPWVRHYPATPQQPSTWQTWDIARNETFSLQVAVRSTEPKACPVRVRVATPEGWEARVRRIGYVPVRHLNLPVEKTPLDQDGVGRIPGYVPDPLFEEDSFLLPPQETHAFWITVRPDPETAPGEYRLGIVVELEGGGEMRHAAPVVVHDLTLAPRQDFFITHWFYVDALIDWYQTDLFDSRFWALLPAYIRDVVAHGQNMLIVPVFTLPLDGVKRPSQLLRVTRTGPDTYDFDWTDVARYVELAQNCGIQRFEWCHLFTQWGAQQAIRVYEGQGHDEKLLWPPETSATSETYRRFLAQYLPQLHRFLQEKNLIDRSMFHVSDEPHGPEQRESYRRARELLRELAPWMRVMDAISEIEFAHEGLIDFPIPSISVAPGFTEEGIECGCYYCCGPRGPYLNRLLDTPLAKIAMHGLLFYRWPFRGFLHWGYNYWYKSQTRTLIDPYCEQDGLAWHRGWAYGDPFEVYPGDEGPIDSMRWEVFGESLQDYCLLQTLGITREDPLLADIVSFADFPKNPDWRRSLRAQLFARAK